MLPMGEESEQGLEQSLQSLGERLERGKEEKRQRWRERESEKKRRRAQTIKVEVLVAHTLTSEVAFHHFCYTHSIKSKSLGPPHTPGKEIMSGLDYQE